jgi:hypothetical protein
MIKKEYYIEVENRKFRIGDRVVIQVFETETDTKKYQGEIIELNKYYMKLKNNKKEIYHKEVFAIEYLESI